MRDGASVNNVAMQVVNIVYPDALDIRCYSHTLDLIGKKFSTPVLIDFCTLWLSLVSPIVLKLKCYGRNKQVGQCLRSVKPVGGVDGRCCIIL